MLPIGYSLLQVPALEMLSVLVRVNQTTWAEHSEGCMKDNEQQSDLPNRGDGSDPVQFWRMSVTSGNFNFSDSWWSRNHPCEDVYSKTIDSFQHLLVHDFTEDDASNSYARGVCMQVIAKLFKIINM